VDLGRKIDLSVGAEAPVKQRDLNGENIVFIIWGNAVAQQ
jgi:hypothetical protein